MTRVLKRPMFRLGGNTDQGIMSGVVPRQGYYTGKKVSELGDMTIGELEQMARASTRGDRRADMRDFMIDWGLGMVGTPPTGNILSTAANVARAPYERFVGRKAERRGVEADMFSTLFKGAVEAGTGGKSYAHRDKAAMVRENMDKQYAIYDQLAALDKEAPEYAEQREKLLRSLRKLKEEVSSDEFAKAQLQYWSDDRNSRQLDEWIRKELEKTFGVALDLTGNVEHINAFNKRREEIMRDIKLGISPTFNFATGGRVGYQQGMSVMPAMQTQADTMPEELSGITYEELRARLPQEVDDQIVRLLANSAEALEDFAVIQTEQDIANFNKKYGVNLVLPAEG